VTGSPSTSDPAFSGYPQLLAEAGNSTSALYAL